MYGPHVICVWAFVHMHLCVLFNTPECVCEPMSLVPVSASLCIHLYVGTYVSVCVCVCVALIG